MALGIEPVLLQARRLHGTERPWTHVEGDRHDAHAAPTHAFEQLLGKV
jgi:hypothetical protein